MLAQQSQEDLEFVSSSIDLDLLRIFRVPRDDSRILLSAEEQVIKRGYLALKADHKIDQFFLVLRYVQCTRLVLLVLCTRTT